MKALLVKFSFLFVLIIASCSPSEEKAKFTLVSWNAYLFFDSRDDGTEYSGFKASDGYTQEVYNKRVKAVAVMIAREMQDADVIVFQEIESNTVLYDLLSSGLKKKGFTYYGLAGNDEGTLSVGFISKHKPVSVNVHSSLSGRKFLSMSFNVNGEIITIIALHLKSRLDGGEDDRANELSLVRALSDLKVDDNLIIMGDFNIDPRYSEAGMANIKDRLSMTAPIVVTGDGGGTEKGVFFSPAIDYMNDIGDGTYFYSDQWFFYDQILFSKKAFDGTGWEYMYSEIIRPHESMDINKYPVKFDSSTGSGMSDHFPIKSVMVYN